MDDGQEARYSAETQDHAYRHGAYDYLRSVEMVPKMSALAGYVRFFGGKSVLDLGCGFGDLLNYLDRDVRYLGLDISPTAIGWAQQRFAGRPDAAFAAVNVWDWQPPADRFDVLVWAGIGRTWTRDGRKGKFRDWLEILERTERALVPDAIVMFELVQAHWQTLEGLIEGRYAYLAGCDIDSLWQDHRAVRSIRVFRRGTAD